MSKVISPIPSSLEMAPSKLKKKISIDRQMIKGTSILTSCSETFNGEISAATPSMNRTLKTLLPTTLPMTIDEFPEREALIPTASSGALVPKATIVRPMIKGGIPKAAAINELCFTRKLAPITSSAKPVIDNR